MQVPQSKHLFSVEYWPILHVFHHGPLPKHSKMPMLRFLHTLFGDVGMYVQGYVCTS